MELEILMALHVLRAIGILGLLLMGAQTVVLIRILIQLIDNGK